MVGGGGVAETRDAHDVSAYGMGQKTLLGSTAISTGKPGHVQSAIRSWESKLQPESATSDNARADTTAPRRRIGLFRRFGRAAATASSFAASLRPRRKAT